MRWTMLLLCGCLSASAVEVGDVVRFAGDGGLRHVTVVRRTSPTAFLGILDGYGSSLNATILDADGGLRIEIDDWREGRLWTLRESAGGLDVSVRAKPQCRRQPCHPKKAVPKPGFDLNKVFRLKKSAKVAVAGITDDWDYDPVTNEVDVLVVFDKTAVSWLEAQNVTAASFAEAQVAKMNAALANSGLSGDFKMTLCGAFNADFDVTKDCGWYFSIRLSVALDLVTESTAQAWAAIRAERERLGADLVVILANSQPTAASINEIGGTIGISFGLEYNSAYNLFGFDKRTVEAYREAAYAACDIRVVNEDNTFGHEAGHIMGAGHSELLDPYYSAPGPQLFPYSAALMYCDSVDGNYYHTIMGYDSVDGSWSSPDYSEIPYYSSPDLQHPVTGSALGDDSHDNVRTLRETYLLISQYRVRQDNDGSSDDQDPVPAPIPNPQDENIAGTIADTAFSRSQIMMGALYDAGGNLAGTMQLKVGKVNARKQTVKISAVAALLNGKKISSKAKNVELVGGGMKDQFVFKDPIREMTFSASASGVFTLRNASYEMRAAKVGGALSTNRLLFNAAVDPFPHLDAGLQILDAALPTNATVHVSGGTKWSCDKAASLKYRKVDGAYQLTGLDGAANPSGLKLSYTSKTGAFKGSFKLYSTNESVTPAGRAPKLKKFSMSVVGFVVDGEGYGQATQKKILSSPWQVSVR